MTPLTVEVELVGGVEDVDVGVVGATGDGVDGQETSGDRVVQADTHEGESSLTVRLHRGPPPMRFGCAVRRKGSVDAIRQKQLT